MPVSKPSPNSQESLHLISDFTKALSEVKMSGKIKEIVVKSSSGFGPIEEAYHDRIKITKNSIKYKYTPYQESKINCSRKWSYETSSPLFRKLFDDLALCIPDVFDNDPQLTAEDTGSIAFKIKYADKTDCERTFFLPETVFQKPFSYIRLMVPACEYMPPLLITRAELDRSEDELIYCSVEFSSGGKTYSYIADTDEYAAGDLVVVPVGQGNRETVARIVSIGHYRPEDAPYPVEMTKHILRKYRNEPVPVKKRKKWKGPSDWGRRKLKKLFARK